MTWSPYLQLIRFHKPVGTLLLFIPTAWALWLANHGAPPITLVIYFFLGTFLMRSAGCVINDIADRNIDCHVKRTKQRPLASAQVTLPAAWGLLIVLCFSAFIILVQLPHACFYYALAALIVTFLYPFCKRFFSAPQLVLGIAFSMGIPMSYVASGIQPNKAMLLLFLINFLWIVAYDTMYAFADREDDKKIGVKSTALLVSGYGRLAIVVLQFLSHSLWLVLAWQAALSRWFLLVWCISLIVLLYQQHLLKRMDPQACIRAFSINVWYGMMMWVALMIPG